MFDTKKIERIHTLAISRQQINEEMREELRPKVRSKTTISFLFGALTAAGVARDVILFVLLYLSAPEVLAEQNMRRGLRNTFATLFGYKSGSAISVRSRNLFFRFRTYKDFRDDVETAIEKAEAFLETFTSSNVE